MSETYVHGYHAQENERLQDQAGTLVDLLHSDTAYPRRSVVLEVGCGVGAQTIILAQRSPDARFMSVDVSADAVGEAKRRAGRAGLTTVEFCQADIFALPFDPESFDHVFVCFVLEHLSQPVEALAILRKLLRPGGTITVIEGDHGSACFHPDNPAAHAAIQCQVRLQHKAGGNALIGRQLYPMLLGAGFDAVRVSPRMVYVDSSRPELVEGFTRKTFTAMIEGIREPAIAAGLIEPETFDAGVQALHRTTNHRPTSLLVHCAARKSEQMAAACRTVAAVTSSLPGLVSHSLKPAPVGLPPLAVAGRHVDVALAQPNGTVK